MPARCLLPRPPNGGRRGGSATGDGARVAMDRARPLGSAPRLKGDGLRVLGSGQPKASASGQRRLFAAKTAILDATQKRQRRSPRALQIQIYFIAWVACAREMMARNVFGCG